MTSPGGGSLRRALKTTGTDRTPNWNKWRLIPNPKLWECVALSLGIDPDKVKINPHGWMANDIFFDESREFKDRIDVACANLSRDGALQPTGRGSSPRVSDVSLRQFAACVRQFGWDAPAELLAIADEEAAHIDTAEAGSVERRKHNKRETEARNREWQARIDALAQDHPGTSHVDLCRMLAKETSGEMSTIRRNTKLRHG